MPVVIAPNIVAPIGELAYAGGYGKARRETAAQVVQARQVQAQLASAERRAAMQVEEAAARDQALLKRAALDATARMQLQQATAEDRMALADFQADAGVQRVQKQQEGMAARQREADLSRTFENMFAAGQKAADPMVRQQMLQFRASYLKLKTSPEWSGGGQMGDALGRLMEEMQTLLAGVESQDPQKAAIEEARASMFRLKELDPSADENDWVIHSGTRWTILRAPAKVAADKQAAAKAQAATREAERATTARQSLTQARAAAITKLMATPKDPADPAKAPYTQAQATAIVDELLPVPGGTPAQVLAEEARRAAGTLGAGLTAGDPKALSTLHAIKQVARQPWHPGYARAVAVLAALRE